jgi:hypothetical protein
VPYSAQESYRIIWHDCFMTCANCFDATLLMWHGDHQRGATGTCRLHASCRCIWHDSFINRTIKKNRFEKKNGQILFSPILIKKIKYKKNPRSDQVGRDVTPPMAADDPILHHPVNGTHEFPADMWTAPNVPSLARRPWL